MDLLAGAVLEGLDLSRICFLTIFVGRPLFNFLLLLHFFDQFQMFLVWLRVDLGVELCLFAEIFIVRNEQTACLLVQSTFWEWHD